MARQARHFSVHQAVCISYVRSCPCVPLEVVPSIEDTIVFSPAAGMLLYQDVVVFEYLFFSLLRFAQL